ncbi:thioredoxin [Ostertagia ostertagi]
MLKITRRLALALSVLMVMNVVSDEFDQLLNESADALIVIDFYATWCGPCKIMGPKFTKMSNEYPSVVFVKIDVDETVSNQK